MRGEKWEDIWDKTEGWFMLFDVGPRLSNPRHLLGNGMEFLVAFVWLFLVPVACVPGLCHSTNTILGTDSPLPRSPLCTIYR